MEINELRKKEWFLVDLEMEMDTDLNWDSTLLVAYFGTDPISSASTTLARTANCYIRSVEQ